MSRTRSFIYKYRRVAYFAMFLIIGPAYFLTSSIDFERTLIHCALDDFIPFVPAFIVPYILWYAYVPLVLALVCFGAPEYFRRQCAVFLGGALFCILIFVLFPSAVDFRPEALGGGLFNRICRMIFESDRPVNVFPSLHCYEALCVHLTAFSVTSLRKKTALRAVSAVMMTLICMSTVLVKQHSVLDVFAGCAVAAAAALIFNLRRHKNDNKTV